MRYEKGMHTNASTGTGYGFYNGIPNGNGVGASQWAEPAEDIYVWRRQHTEWAAHLLVGGELVQTTTVARLL